MKLTREVLRRINLLLIIFALVLIVLYFICPYLNSYLPQKSYSDEPIIVKPHHPGYENIPLANLEAAFDSSFLKLKTSGLDQKVPELRQQILFYGANGRPDSDKSSTFVRIGIRGQNKSYSVPALKKVYLKFMFGQGYGKWTLAEGDETTPFWIEVQPFDREAEINVFLQDAKGEIIRTPAELATFRVPITPLPPQEQTAQAFEVGPYTADPSLFSKMGAVWHGKDVVYEILEKGSEKAEKELILFGREGETYALWASVGDCFIFENERFYPVTLGKDSVDRILLRLTRRDDNVLHFTLWNTTGQSQVSIDLPRIPASPINTNFPIKLLGARSRTKLIAELSKTRTLISSDEWLLQTKDGIIPIQSHELLEQYLNGHVRGTLLALEGIKKINNQSVLTGILIDPSRIVWQEFSIPLYRSSQSNDQKSNELQDSDDDDDDDDDILDDDSSDDDDTNDLDDEEQ